MESENTKIERQGNDDVLCEDITLSEYFGRDARRYDNGFETY